MHEALVPALTVSRFEALMDQILLEYWITQRDHSKRRARWLHFLCGFKQGISLIPATIDTATNAQTRHPYVQREELSMPSIIIIDHTEISKLNEAYIDTIFNPNNMASRTICTV